LYAPTKPQEAQELAHSGHRAIAELPVQDPKVNAFYKVEKVVLS
jgi:hypothetical protein